MYVNKGQRISLLQGLMDCDGTVDRRSGLATYCTSSYRLRNDLVWLVRSLGGVATVSRKENEHKGAWIISLNLPKEIMPFTLTRKASLYRPNEKYFPRRKIVSIDSVGEKQAQCIRVEHESRLYLTDDFVVTHNTFSGLGTVKRFAKTTDKILIVAPSQKVLNDWGNTGRDFFGLNINVLDGIDNAGSGITATTYANLGENDALQDRDFDLVVYDESHNLLQQIDGKVNERTLRHFMLTKHPDHANSYSYMKLEKEMADLKVRREAGEDTSTADKEAAAKRAALKEQYLAKKRPNVMFLSASPFAYHKTVRYADSYLFDFQEGNREESGKIKDQMKGYSYNSGDSEDSFFMEHFGYRMRTNKLTQPEAEVDQALMERRFNEFLVEKGALSRRMLDIPQDYSREFHEYSNVLGEKIDTGMNYINGYRIDDEGHYERLSEDELAKLELHSNAVTFLKEKWDYHYKMALLEGLNAREAVQRSKKHLAMGRKVVVFHRYKSRTATHPFRFDGEADQSAVDAYAKFMASNIMDPEARAIRQMMYAEQIKEQMESFTKAFPELSGMPLDGLSNPINAFKAEFGDRVGFFNGDVSAKNRIKDTDRFNTDGGDLDIQVVQIQAGKEGISLHDVTGEHQRALISVTLPVAATDSIQMEGRIYRTGQVTDAVIEYLITGLGFESSAYANTIAQRTGTAETWPWV